MKDGLIHIKYDRETPGFVFDISEHKIHYDSIEGNYRRRLKCECGKMVECFCFGSLDAAMETTHTTHAICNRCYLKENIEEFDEIMGHDRKPLSQMTDDEIDEVIKIIFKDTDVDSDMDMGVCGL